MRVGQVLGPFKIDKELGSGAMGSVFRGVYTKTGQKVAIKVMAPGLTSNEQSVRRFEREISILKQLNHPNIVRYFGTGKDPQTGSRWYAMEYVEGDALDKVMSRRGRMTWEEIVALGLQLCGALQHAHEKGVIHRDLKPSNLMILRDGTLKLADFGIAKGLDLSGLTETNCTVGTAAYMSPEQCQGHPITHKSDLYSMGVVFYELVTGKKPFIRDNPMDMFMAHVKDTAERPSRLVLDIPVWLDNLICQLLEKKPEHRPYDAATVANALASIQEKVEAQQSAGVVAAKQRRIDRLANQSSMPIDETDREMARTLIGKKKGKKKKVAFYQTGWFVGLGVAALLAGLGLVLWLLLGPPAPDKLYSSAEKLMASKNPTDWEKASEGPIKTYLDNYANRPGPQTEQIDKWEKAIRINRNEALLAKYLKKKKSPIKFDAQNDAEKAAFSAIDAEEAGDLKLAREKWKAITEKFGSGSGFVDWGKLAQKHLELLDQIASTEKQLGQQYNDLVDHGREPHASNEAKEAALAYWFRCFGDPIVAQRSFKAISDETRNHLEKAEDDERLLVFVGPERLWRVLAAAQDRELQEVLKNNPSAEKDRTEVVKKKVEEAKQAVNPDKKYGLYRIITLLYDKEGAMKPYFEEASKYVVTHPR